MSARAALGVALLAAAACADPLAAARNAGVHYLETRVESADARWAGLFGYLHRRFGLAVRLRSGEALHEAPGDPARPELAAIYRRLDDPTARASRAQIAALPTAVDRIVASALHCDRIGLPPEWPDILRKAAEKGGYALTHSVLAAEWTLENGCLSWEALAPLHTEQVRRLEALLEDRAALDASSPKSTDLFLEALVMLYYTGAGSRVRPEWIDAVLAAQRPDGGWPLRPGAGRSDPHPTALALWVLLENLQPEAPRIRWVPPAGGTAP